jgi:hypothetical protein
MSMILEGIPAEPHRASQIETPTERAVRDEREGIVCQWRHGLAEIARPPGADSADQRTSGAAAISLRYFRKPSSFRTSRVG